MNMTERYKTKDPLSFKGRGTPAKKKPRPKLKTYKGRSFTIKPFNPSVKAKRKGL